MNDVVIDTHVVIWYFSQPVLPSSSAQSAVAAAVSSGSIIVSAITIVELIYLLEKKRIPADILITLRNALDDPASAFRLVELNREISDEMENIPRSIVPDMPDRIIAATALYLNVPLVTKDTEIRSLQSVRTIW